MRKFTRPLAILMTLAGLILISVGILLYDFFSSESDASELIVVSYSSFLNEWGPAPDIERLFQEQTGLRLRWVDAGDAGLIVERLRFQSGQMGADLVIGLDQWTLEEAQRVTDWLPIDTASVHWHPQLPGDAVRPQFVPFDWSPMALIYREGEIEPPTSLAALQAPEYNRALALQDPRTSSPGLQFVYWVLMSQGLEDGFLFLKELMPRLHSVSNSWSTAYGLFQSGRAPMTFSYLTSPIYHQVEENDSSYRAAVFPEGHPYQVEYFAIPAGTARAESARALARFLLTPDAQRIIMKKNYMRPTIAGVEEGTVFAEIPEVPLLSKTVTLPTKREILQRWKEQGL